MEWQQGIQDGMSERWSEINECEEGRVGRGSVGNYLDRGGS